MSACVRKFWMLVKPISPNEATRRHQEEIIPNGIIRIVNQFLVERLGDSKSVRITQDELLARITSTLNISRHEVFSKNLLDFESLYREAGWIVKYDKPGPDESYDTFFLFRLK